MQNSAILGPAAVIRDGLALSPDGLPRRCFAREAHEPVVEGAAKPDQQDYYQQNDGHSGNPEHSPQPNAPLTTKVVVLHVFEWKSAV